MTSHTLEPNIFDRVTEPEMELFRQFRHFPQLRQSMRAVQALNTPQGNVQEVKKPQILRGSSSSGSRAVEKKMHVSSFKELTQMEQIRSGIRAKTRQLRRYTADEPVGSLIPSFPPTAEQSQQFETRPNFTNNNDVPEDDQRDLTWQQLITKLQKCGFAVAYNTLDIAGLLAVLALPSQPRSSRLQLRLYEILGIKIADEEAQLLSQYCLLY